MRIKCVDVEKISLKKNEMLIAKLPKGVSYYLFDSFRRNFKAQMEEIIGENSSKQLVILSGDVEFIKVEKSNA